MTSFFFITVAALVSGVRMETCPPEEDISPCSCRTYEKPYENVLNAGDLQVICAFDQSLSDQTGLKRALSSLSGKQNVFLALYNFAFLGRVPSDFFSGIGIKVLMIEGCPLETLSEGGPALRGLEDTLEHLGISKSYTGVNAAEEFQFGRFKRLKSITLDHNNITEVGDDWFPGGPTTIENLSIVDNIEKVGTNAFISLVNLKYVYLGGFRQILRSMLPSPAYHLKAVHIGSTQSNAVTELSEDIFTAMPALTIVDIKRNGIKTLEERVWSPVWQQLQWLDLLDNPILCDDQMNWLFNLRVPYTFYGECDSPQEHRGKKLRDFIISKRQ